MECFKAFNPLCKRYPTYRLQPVVVEKIPEGTLRKYRVSGKGFKYIKIGGRILYRVEDIETYIENHTFGSTTEQQNSA